MAATHLVADVVIDRDDDDRRRCLIAGYLNELHQRHGLPLLPNAVDPSAEVGLLIMDLQPLGNGRWQMDVARARKATSEQAPSFWELELRASDRTFIGRWEDVPPDSPDTFDFDLDALPRWLNEQVV